MGIWTGQKGGLQGPSPGAASVVRTAQRDHGPSGLTSLHFMDKEYSFLKKLFLKNPGGKEMPARGRQRGRAGGRAFCILELSLSRQSEFCFVYKFVLQYKVTPNGPNSRVEKQLIFITWF